MAHYSPYRFSSQLATHRMAKTADSFAETPSAWSYAKPTATVVKGEYVAGALLTAVVTVWTGWLMWALSNASGAY